MPKVLLFRASDELKLRLMSDLAGAGYEVSAPQRADVQTVLQYEPDLILLQTDVKLDCCGVIAQLKGFRTAISARVPAGAKPVAHFQPHARVTRDIADVSGFHAMLCDDPELLANASAAYRSPARLSGLAAGGFEERIPRRR